MEILQEWLLLKPQRDKGAEMVKRMKKLEFFNQVMVDQPFLSFLIPLGLFAWFFERSVVTFSNWVPPVTDVWVTIQVVIISPR
jgi:hypothetical protein